MITVFTRDVNPSSLRKVLWDGLGDHWRLLSCNIDIFHYLTTSTATKESTDDSKNTDNHEQNNCSSVQIGPAIYVCFLNEINDKSQMNQGVNYDTQYQTCQKLSIKQYFKCGPVDNLCYFITTIEINYDISHAIFQDLSIEILQSTSRYPKIY